MTSPLGRGEIMDLAIWVGANSLQDIDQVGVEIDSVHLAGYDETLEDAYVLGSHLGPAKQPVFPAHGNHP